MLHELWVWLNTQQFLLGGLGAVSLSALLYAIKSAPKRASNVGHGLFVSTLNVRSQSTHYEPVDMLVGRHVRPWASRKYEPDFHNGKIVLLGGEGVTYGRWRGVWFARSMTRDVQARYGDRSLTLRFLTRDRDIVLAFLAEAHRSSREKPEQRVSVSTGMGFSPIAPKPLRSLDTVFVNGAAKAELVGRVRAFRESEGWHLARGVPYKLVVLLHGPPGTGKTSLVHALASNFELAIRYVRHLGVLGELLSDIGRECVVVIEDIDALGELSRELADTPVRLSPAQGEEGGIPLDEVRRSIGMPASAAGSPTWSDAATSAPAPRQPGHREMDFLSPLHDTLNTLDGFMTPHGLIAVITTNHPERLDPALLRSGRIDLTLEVGPLDWDAASEMFVAFYGEDASGWDSLRDRYVPTVGAELQEAFRQDRGRALAALTERWSA